LVLLFIVPIIQQDVGKKGLRQKSQWNTTVPLHIDSRKRISNLNGRGAADNIIKFVRNVRFGVGMPLYEDTSSDIIFFNEFLLFEKDPVGTRDISKESKQQFYLVVSFDGPHFFFWGFSIIMHCMYADSSRKTLNFSFCENLVYRKFLFTKNSKFLLFLGFSIQTFKVHLAQQQAEILYIKLECFLKDSRNKIIIIQIII
jgi:hypothetical protein